ncbi:MAG: shikimate kinase [Halarsenatibacteraceae bacterium]
MIITLIGMMGSGKSTVAKLIAENFDYIFFDTDSLIVKKTGREITDIFKEDGEKYFRDLEKEIIKNLYNRNDNKNKVIATGGGAVLSEINRNIFLNKSKVYWLNVKTEKLADRLYKNKDRPLIKEYKDKKLKLIKHLDNILRARYKYYQIGIEIDGNKEPVDIVREIINDLRDEVDRIE